MTPTNSYSKFVFGIKKSQLKPVCVYIIDEINKFLPL